MIASFQVAPPSDVVFTPIVYPAPLKSFKKCIYSICKVVAPVVLRGIVARALKPVKEGVQLNITSGAVPPALAVADCVQFPGLIPRTSQPVGGTEAVKSSITRRPASAIRTGFDSATPPSPILL